MPASLTQPQPLADAIAQISARTPIGALLRSAEWAEVPLAIRNAALFSAGVENARVLQRMKDFLSTWAGELRRPDGTLQRRDQFIAELRDLAIREGLTPEDPSKRGTIQDITSFPRLKLIWDIQTQQAQGYAQWKAEQDPDILDAFPAQELIRVENRRVPRDWFRRWIDAGGQIYDGRLVALKNAPIWRRISRFGNPWPPYDYNSGMGLEDVSRDEAEELGLLGPDDELKPMQEDFDEHLQASTRGLDPEMLATLEDYFGERIVIDGDTVRWNKSANRRNLL